MQLTIEEEENLRDLLLNHEGVKPFLKLMQQHVDAQVKAILTLTLNCHDDERRLAYQRCRADGARKLFNDFSTALGQRKKKADKEDE